MIPLQKMENQSPTPHTTVRVSSSSSSSKNGEIIEERKSAYTVIADMNGIIYVGHEQDNE